MQAHLGMEMLADYDTAHHATVLLPRAEGCGAPLQVLHDEESTTAPQDRTSTLRARLAAVGERLRVRTVPRVAGGS